MIEWTDCSRSPESAILNKASLKGKWQDVAPAREYAAGLNAVCEA